MLLRCCLVGGAELCEIVESIHRLAAYSTRGFRGLDYLHDSFNLLVCHRVECVDANLPSQTRVLLDTLVGGGVDVVDVANR